MKNLSVLFLFLPLLLGGCIGDVVGGALSTGTAVAQKRTIGDVVDDTAIFWQIKHSYLRKNAQDLLAGVNVEVIEGRVYLTGNVDTPDTRIDAVRLAWQPEGVKEVVNEINVNSEKTLKEVFGKRLIKTQVVSKLLTAKDVRSMNYSVEVVDGVVYLMGIARDVEELNQVTNLARTVKGVRKVVSHVEVSGS